jgi:TP901 family phage tail tape measure protein
LAPRVDEGTQKQFEAATTALSKKLNVKVNVNVGQVAQLQEKLNDAIKKLENKQASVKLTAAITKLEVDAGAVERLRQSLPSMLSMSITIGNIAVPVEDVQKKLNRAVSSMARKTTPTVQIAISETAAAQASINGAINRMVRKATPPTVKVTATINKIGIDNEKIEKSCDTLRPKVENLIARKLQLSIKRIDISEAIKHIKQQLNEAFQTIVFGADKPVSEADKLRKTLEALKNSALETRQALNKVSQANVKGHAFGKSANADYNAELRRVDELTRKINAFSVGKDDALRQNGRFVNAENLRALEREAELILKSAAALREKRAAEAATTAAAAAAARANTLQVRRGLINSVSGTLMSNASSYIKNEGVPKDARFDELRRQYEEWLIQTNAVRKNVEAISTADLNTHLASGQALTRQFKELNETTKQAAPLTKAQINSAMAGFATIEKQARDLRTALSGTANSQQLAALDELAAKLQRTTAHFSGGATTMPGVGRDMFTSVNEAKATLRTLESDLTRAGAGVENLGQKITRVFGQKLGFGLMVSSTLLLRRALRNVMRYATEIDAKLGELQVVTNAGADAMDKFGASVGRVARQIGASMTDIIDAVTVFSRLGYSLEESLDLSKFTTIFSRAAAVDMEDAESAVTGIIKAFDFDASQIESVLDKMTYVGNKFPISASELAEGMNNAASALAGSGNSFDQALGILTAANTTVQNISKASTAVSTMSARIRNSKTELEELGETMEEEYDTVAKYRKGLLAIAEVDILKDDGATFKPMFQILDELHDKWSSLTDLQRATVTTMFSGTRNINVFSSIMGEWEEAEKVVTRIGESTGELARAQEVYSDTVRAHINKFTATAQALATKAINTGFLNLLIDGAALLVRGLGALTGAFGGLIPKIGAAAVAASLLALVIGKLGKAILGLSLLKLIRNIGMYIQAIRLITHHTTGFIKTIKQLHAGLPAFGTSLGAVATAILQAAAILATVIFSIVQAVKQAREARRQAALDAGGELDEQSKSIDEYILKIKELKDTLKSGVASEKEQYDARVELVDIQKSLVELLGSEANGLNLLSQSADGAAKSIKELARQEAELYLIENQRAINEANSAYERTRDYSVSLVKESLYGADKETREAKWADYEATRGFIDTLSQKYSELGVEFSEDSSTASGVVEFRIDIDDKTYAEAKRILQDLAKDIRDMRNDPDMDVGGGVAANFDSMLDGISARLTKINGEIGKYEEVLEYAVANTIVATDKFYNLQEDAKGASGALTDALLLGDKDAADAALRDMDSVIAAYGDMLENGEIDNAAVAAFFADLFAEMQKEADRQKAKIRLEVDIQTNINNDAYSLNRAMKSFVDENGNIDYIKVINAGVEYENTGGAAGPLRGAILDYKRLDDAAQGLGNTVEELLPLLVDFGLASGLTNMPGDIAAQTDEFGRLGEAIEAAKDAFDILAQAQTDFKTSGELGISTLKDIVALGGDFSKYLKIADGKLVADADALMDKALAPMSDYVDKQKAQLDAYREQFDALTGMSRSTGLAVTQIKEMDALDKKIAESEKNITIYERAIEALREETNEAAEVFEALADAVKKASDVMKTGFDEMASGNGLLLEEIKSVIGQSAADDPMKYLDVDEDNLIHLKVELFGQEVVKKEVAELINGLPDEIDTETKTRLQEALGFTIAKERIKDALDAMQDQADAFAQLHDTIAEYNAEGKMTEEMLDALTGGDLMQYLEKTENGWKVNTDAMSEAFRALYDFVIQEFIATGNTDALRTSMLALDAITKKSGGAINALGGSLGAYSSEAMLAAQRTVNLAKVQLAWLGMQVSQGGSTVREALADKIKLYSDMLTVAQEQLEGVDAPVVPARSPTSSGSKSEDTAFEKESRELEHRLSMRQITYEKYVDALIALEAKHRNVLKKDADDWYTALEKIFDAQTELHERRIAEMEHSLYLQEQQYERYTQSVAEPLTSLGGPDDGDFNLATRSNLEDQLDIYTAIMNRAHEEAERLRGLNIDENDDMIQSLQKTWWDAYNAHRETVIKLGRDIVDTFGDVVSTVSGVYDTLMGAAQEFAENGYLAVETFRNIIGLGVEYLKYLYDENGAIKVNEEALRKLVEAKLQDLAVSQARALIDMVKAHSDDAAALRELAYASDAASESVWGLVYAELAALNIDDDLYRVFLNQIDAIRAMADAAKAGIGAAADSLKDYYEQMKDALDTVLDSVMELVKYEAEQQVEALKEQVEQYQKIIEEKKKALELAKSEVNYEKTIAKKVAEIAKLRARINALELDDSREGQLQKAKLIEELAGLQEELTDEQNEHAYDKQTDTLDEMQKAFETEKDAEIKIVEDSVSSTQKIYEKAIAKLESDYAGTMRDVMAWNYEAGSSLESALMTAWQSASVAVQEYNGFLVAQEAILARLNEQTAALGAVPETPTTVATVGGTTGYASGQSLASQMRRNSVTATSMNSGGIAWTDPQIKALNEKNKELAGEIAKAMGLTYGRDIYFDAASGKWYVNGKELYEYFNIPLYHGGGVVGDADNKDKEQFALLERGEWVLADKQKQLVGELIDLSGWIDELSNRIRQSGGFSTSSAFMDNVFGGAFKTGAPAGVRESAPQTVVTVDASLSLNGFADKEVIEVIKRHPRAVAEQVARALA